MILKLATNIFLWQGEPQSLGRESSISRRQAVSFAALPDISKGQATVETLAALLAETSVVT